MSQQSSETNCRGQDFSGRDLSGVIFRGDIRGANFSNTVLRDATFENVEAGLTPRQRWYLLSGIFILGFLLIIILQIACQRTGERFIYRPPPGSSLSDVNLNLWAAFVILGMFVVSAWSISKGLIVSVKATFLAGVTAVGITFLYSLTQATGRVIAHQSLATLLGSANRLVIQTITASVTGFAFVVIVMAIATAASAAQIIDGKSARNRIRWGFLSAVTLFSIAAFTGGSHPITIVSGWTISIVSIFVGDFYVARQILAENEKFITLRQIAVTISATGGTSFREADLTDANFAGATLRCTDFQSAQINRTNWRDAKRLEYARLGNTILSNNQVRRLLISGSDDSRNLSGCNLRGANLRNADLRNVNLTEADISDATFEEADLRNSNLTKVRATGTNFRYSNMTGVCLESWNIDELTQLENVNCDYVYNRSPRTEQMPVERNFVPGEFTHLYQRTANIAKLLFQDGVHWVSFARTLRKLQIENQDTPLLITSLTNKGDGVVVVEVELPRSENKVEFQQAFMEGYNHAVKVLEPLHKARITDKNEHIADQKMSINKLFSQMLTLTSKVVTMAEQPKVQLNFPGTVYGVAGNVEGDQNINLAKQRQTLAEAALEIQQLLYQLSQTDPISPEAVIEAVHQEIRRNPTLKSRLLSALKAGGLEALKSIFDHPLFSIPAETVKGWLEAE